METKDMILELRKSLGLSQAEFAGKLLVTRQAVSRWENGETVPSTDTLKQIAKTFAVPVDRLLGQPAGLCQSCGIRLETERDRGTERDGSRSEDYCAWCYQRGEFVQELTMEQQIEHNLRGLDGWNRANGTNLTEQQARAGLREFLPGLKRWKKEKE